MARRIAIVVLSLLALLSLVMSGCAPSPAETPTSAGAEPTAIPEEEKPDTYKIALGTPLTGDVAMYGPDHVTAAEMAVEEINAAGGIDGVPVELVVEDDQCAGEGYLRAMTKVNAQAIPIYASGFCSSAVLNACSKAQELGMVFYAHGSNPRIASECGDYTFQTWGNDRDQGIEQAKIVEWLGAEEVAVVYTNNDYGIGVKDGFVEQFTANGGTVLVEVPVMQDGTDFRTEITKLKALEPEYTIFEMYGPPGVIFLKQSLELGFETQFIGDVNWAEMSNLELAGEAAEGMISMKSGTPDSPEGAKFQETFEAQSGHAPAFGADQTYDQIMLAARAIELGGYTAEGIRDATMQAAEDYVGPSGPKAMSSERYAMYVLNWTQYVDGEVVSLQDTATPETEKPDTYKIALGTPLTGDVAMYGPDHVTAAEMAVEEINAAGGIDGVPVELVVEDDQCAGEGYLRAMTKVNAQAIPIYASGFCSSAVLNACSKAQELGMVFYAHGSNPRIASECGDYTFQTWGNDRDQGIEQAKIVEWLGAEEVAVVYTNNDYGIGVKDGFVEQFTANGGTVLVEVPVMQDGTDFRTEITKLKALEPEYTIFEMYGPPGVIFLKQSLELGFETQFIGDVNWAEMSNLELAGEAAEGMISMKSGTPDSPEGAKFQETFEAQSGHAPAFGADQTYDQIMLAARAIELGGYTAEGIRDATMQAAEDYVGPSGPKAMSSERYAMYVLNWTQYVDGEVVSLQH